MSDKKRWPSDIELVQACRKGDGAAWETLIRRYQRLIFSVPVAYRIPSEEAEEIFQRVVVKLFENLPRLRRAESLPAWLVTTARRECHAHFRSSRRTDPPPEEETVDLAEDPPDLVRSIDGLRAEQILALAFERLDAPCRRLLGALYLEDGEPSYQEIAARLGRPVGSLGPTRSRCLRKLRKLFLEMGGEPP